MERNSNLLLDWNSITNVQINKETLGFVSGATWDGSNATIDTELPHDLKNRIYS